MKIDIQLFADGPSMAVTFTINGVSTDISIASTSSTFATSIEEYPISNARFSYDTSGVYYDGDPLYINTTRILGSYLPADYASAALITKDVKYVGKAALQELVTKMKQYVDNKEITLDDTVTQSSSNGVKSSGIYTALSAKQNALTAGANITIANNVISASGVAEVTASTIRIYGYDPGVYKLNSAAGSGEISIFYNGSTSTDALEINDQFNNQCVLMISYNQDSPVRKSYTWVLISSGKIYVGNTTSTSGTYSELQTKLTFDASPTSASTNPVTSGGVYTALSGKQASLNTNQLAAVNSGITSTLVGQISTNQNNITSLSSSKQDVLTFDTTPTNGSTNPVTSDGIYDALVLKADKSGAVGSFVLSINSTTYVITLQAKDVNGNNLGTAQTIDLPLESVVVSGSYDSATQKVILTLKDGSTIDFSVADLISGLQTEITTTNKLSADLVDDTSTTNKFVSATEKTTWNGKQNAITNASKLSADLVDDTSTTHKFVTASDKTTWNGKQDAMTAITTAEVDALFS